MVEKQKEEARQKSKEVGQAKGSKSKDSAVEEIQIENEQDAAENDADADAKKRGLHDETSFL